VIQRDPFADSEALIRQVYTYVSYRIGHGPEAEDVTSETFERAFRYRQSYDSSKGKPISWLLGIARRVVADRRQDASEAAAALVERPFDDLEAKVVDRVVLSSALARLEERDQELLALRYGADLKARQIAEVLGMSTNAVKVALHRAIGKLRRELGGEEQSNPSRSPSEAAETL
jgi:RNA polymerase sigma factor (sigma-70 family)